MSTGMNARIAANVRGELQRRCMSVEQLAYAVGMSHRDLALRLDSEVSFYTNELGAITEYLGVPIAALIR